MNNTILSRISTLCHKGILLLTFHQCLQMGLTFSCWGKSRESAKCQQLRGFVEIPVVLNQKSPLGNKWC